jgi:monofunctional biosynthetic peptidoglycan transglycosylase
MVRTATFLPLLVGLLPSVVLGQEPEMKTIVDFEDPDAVRWRIVNDGVMGGVSSSDLELTENQTVMFTGSLSLENNGGFASVRATFPSLDLSGYEGVLLRVKGDGRTYQLRFRTSNNFDGVAYSSEFGTEAGEWSEIRLPLSGFKPTFRGRVPRGAGPFDSSRIRQMTFLIGDKREGPFELEIDWVKAYRS